MKAYRKPAALTLIMSSLLLVAGCVTCGQHTNTQSEQSSGPQPPPIDYPTNIPK